MGIRSFLAKILLEESSMLILFIRMLIRFSITPMKSLTLWEVIEVLELKTFKIGASSQDSCLQGKKQVKLKRFPQNVK